MSQQINLFNPVFLKQKKLFSAVAMAQALGLIVVGLLALVAISSYSVRKLEDEAKVTARRLTSTQAQLTAIVERSRPSAADPAIEEETKKIQARIDADKQILAFVRRDASGAASGYSDVLRAFARKTSPGVWLTGFTLDDGTKDLEIRGRALQPSLVAPYVMSLGDEAAFKGRTFGTMVLQNPEASGRRNEDAGMPARRDVPQAKAQVTPLRYVEFRLNTADAIVDKQAGGRIADALEGAGK